MRTTLVAAVVLVAGVAISGSRAARAGDGTESDGDGEVVERAELVIGPSRVPIGAVVVDNLIGDLRIEGHDGDTVSIVAVKHAPDTATLGRLRVTLVPDPDGTVRLSTMLGAATEGAAAALHTVRIDLTIRVPRNARIEGRVGSGRLEVRNTDAGADLDAGAGQIFVRNVAGLVQARSLAGSQRFEEVFGTLDSHALDADVALDTVRGAALTAQVYGGDIDGQRVTSRQVRMSTISGDIRLDAEPQAGGSMSITSLRGNVDVTLRGAVGASVRARAGGRLTMPDGVPSATDRPADRWVEAQYGARRSRASVRIESRFGDLAFSLAQ